MEQQFGDRLRMLRRRRGMTQGDLARALGCTVQTVVRYEGLRIEEVRPAKLKAIAGALGVEPWELTGEEPVDEEINTLTRGLKRMDPEQRANLIRMVMPYVMQCQRPEADEAAKPAFARPAAEKGTPE